MDSLSSLSPFGSFYLDSEISLDLQEQSELWDSNTFPFGEVSSNDIEIPFIEESSSDYFAHLETVQGNKCPPLQGRVKAEQSPLTQQSLVFPSQIPSFLPRTNHKRQLVNPQTPLPKKIKTDNSQSKSVGKGRIASQKFREREQEKLESLTAKVENLKERINQLYQSYNPACSLNSELQSFLKENPLTLESYDEEVEEFENSLKKLPKTQQADAIKKFRNKMSARRARERKKKEIASLKHQKFFLEDKITEAFSTLSTLNRQNAALIQENWTLKLENTMLNQKLGILNRSDRLNVNSYLLNQ